MTTREYLPRKAGGQGIVVALYRPGFLDDMHGVLNLHSRDWQAAEARFPLSPPALLVGYTDTDGAYPQRRHLTVRPGEYLACGLTLFTLSEEHLLRWYELAE